MWVLGTLCNMQLDLFLSPLFIMLLSAVDNGSTGVAASAADLLVSTCYEIILDFCSLYV